METLQELPALVVLERLPVPVLAVASDGQILFANTAFGDMVGRTAESVLRMRFDELFTTMAIDESVVAAVREHADLVVELRHSDGSTVRAWMSRSALVRDDDEVALAVFTDLTEQFWRDES